LRLFGPAIDTTFPSITNLTSPVTQQFPNVIDAVPVPCSVALIIPIASAFFHPNHGASPQDPEFPSAETSKFHGPRSRSKFHPATVAESEFFKLFIVFILSQTQLGISKSLNLIIPVLCSSNLILESSN
jgi:hypothetical protein